MSGGHETKHRDFERLRSRIIHAIMAKLSRRLLARTKEGEILFSSQNVNIRNIFNPSRKDIAVRLTLVDTNIHISLSFTDPKYTYSSLHSRLEFLHCKDFSCDVHLLILFTTL